MNKPRLAMVLWDGAIGGAEVFMASLAARLGRLDVDTTMVFVSDPRPLVERTGADGVPYLSLGFGRGRDVVRHPRRFAAAVTDAGADGALLVECGFMGAALRAGGYAGTIVAIEHGSVFELAGYSRERRGLYRLSRRLGAISNDAEVGVSDFVLEQLRAQPHARRTRRIYNGIDPPSALGDGPDGDPGAVRIGFVGRLVPGKGLEYAIRALARVRLGRPARLLIAGEGPERSRLAALAETLQIGSDLDWVGPVADVAAFWRRCDIAVVPSDGLESFSMTTLEAMACARPVVASRIGAIPELVVDGVTGTLVAPGDVGSLAGAVVAYAERPDLRRAHGSAGRSRVVSRFALDDSARNYLELFASLAKPTRPRALSALRQDGRTQSRRHRAAQSNA
jgi:glycosyltransferase involved in cell wall biosynthesis